jgi:RecA-family ATPase
VQRQTNVTDITNDGGDCNTGDEDISTPFEFPLPGEVMPDPPKLANEPVLFQELWATDIAALTYEQLCALRENKWPDNLDPDDVSDDARRRWHLRVWAPTAAEIADDEVDENNPRNVARGLIQDEHERRETGLLIHGADESELESLNVEINDRVASLEAMPPTELAYLIGALANKKMLAEEFQREKLAEWRRRNEEIEQAAHVQAEGQESGIPFMITSADKAKLAALGWTADDIFYMTPSDAQRLIRKSESKPQPEGQREAPPPDAAPSPDGISAHNRQQAEQAERAKAALNIHWVRASDLAKKPMPKRSWLIKDLIPGRNVTLLVGDGGVGKSRAAMQLAVGTAATGRWFDMQIETVDPVIVYAAEDEMDENQIRLGEICRAEGIDLRDLDDLHVAPLAGLDAMLSSFDSRTQQMTPSPLWYGLRRKAEAIRPKLVIIDTAADVFAGDENKRKEVRQFVGLLSGLAFEYDCAVVLLAHPSVAGIVDGTGRSGTTGWNNAVRSRLYFERIIDREQGYPQEPDRNARRLSNNKLNYGVMGMELRVRWDDGVFVREDSRLGAPSSEETDKAAERVFLECLAMFESQGREVSPKSGPNYAPAVFAKLPKAKGYGKGKLRAAMESLLEAKTIRYAHEKGPDYKIHSFLTTKPKTAADEPDHDLETGEVYESAPAPAAPMPEPELSPVEVAVQFLRDCLAVGSVPQAQVLADARAGLIAEKTLRRVGTKIGVKAAKQGKVWMWSLPQKEDGHVPQAPQKEDGQ